MNHRGVAIQSIAQADIEQAVYWYEEKSAGLGRGFINELNFVANRISENPRQFPKVEKEIRRALMRRFPFGVYFVSANDSIAVIAVLHLHGHPDKLRGRG